MRRAPQRGFAGGMRFAQGGRTEVRIFCCAKLHHELVEPRGLSLACSKGPTSEASLEGCAIARAVELKFESFAAQNSTTNWWSLGDYPWLAAKALRERLRRNDTLSRKVVELKFSSPEAPDCVGILEPRGLSRRASGSASEASLEGCAIARAVELKFESFAAQNSTTNWWSLGDYPWLAAKALRERLRRNDTLSRKVVELKFSSPEAPDCVGILEPRGFEPLIRQQKAVNVRRSPFYEILKALDIDGLPRTL